MKYTTYIPATKGAAEIANEYLRNYEENLEQYLAGKKRLTLADKTQKARLEYAKILNDFNEARMEDALDLLEPKKQSLRISSRAKTLSKLTKEDLCAQLATLETQLAIERKYGELVQKTIEYLTNHIDGEQYEKERANNARQTNKQAKYALNEEKIIECINKLKSQLSRPLTGVDYLKLKRLLIKTYPSPDYVPKTRLTASGKRLFAPTNEERTILGNVKANDLVDKRDGWAESTIRKVFEKTTGHTIKSKKLSSPK